MWKWIKSVIKFVVIYIILGPITWLLYAIKWIFFSKR